MLREKLETRYLVSCEGWKRSCGHHLFCFGVPGEGFALALRFNSHFDGDHGGGAEFDIAAKGVLAPDDIEPVAFEVAAFFDRDSQLVPAVVFRMELLLEIAIETEERFAAEVHRAVLAIDAIRNARIVGQ